MESKGERIVPFIYSKKVKAPRTVIVEIEVKARGLIVIREDNLCANTEYGSVYTEQKIPKNLSDEERESLRIDMSLKIAEKIGWDPEKVVSCLGGGGLQFVYIEDDEVFNKYRERGAYKPIVKNI